MDTMSANASFLCHIDENEYENLCSVFGNIGLLNLGTVIWDKRNPMTGGTGLATQHEYIIWRSKNNITINLNTTSIAEMLDYVKMLIAKHGSVNADVRKEYSEWINKNKNLSGGEKAYRYIEDDGRIYQSVSLRAPEPRSDAKFHIPLIHPVTNKPCAIPQNGFSRTPETLSGMIENGEILFGENETTQPRQKMFLTKATQRQMTTVIQDAKKGKADTDLLGVYFPYCHPVSLYENLLGAAARNYNAIIFDFFAGSGTSGHATINLNREDDGMRKYILVEMGEHFDTVLKPRIQKVIYSKDWKDGKPLSREGSSHMFKYMYLESYDDTLDNLRAVRTKRPGNASEKMSAGAREDYMLSYMLNVETKASDSLLNIDRFRNPFSYTLKIRRDNELKDEKIDLVETFNYLIGLYVEQTETIRGFKVVRGKLRTGEKTLVIWRNTQEKSNEALDEFFQKQKYNTLDFEFDLIFVNGDNNLENLKVGDEKWKVRLIEEEFKKRMFAEDV